MSEVLLMMTLGLLPNPTNASVTEVDVIELNCVASSGDFIEQVQWIFWEMESGHLHVVSHAGDSESDNLIRRTHGYELHIHHRGLRYIVTAPVFKRSFTNYDPERADRRELHPLDRHGLNTPDSLLRILALFAKERDTSDEYTSPKP